MKSVKEITIAVKQEWERVSLHDSEVKYIAMLDINFETVEQIMGEKRTFNQIIKIKAPDDLNEKLVDIFNEINQRLKGN